MTRFSTPSLWKWDRNQPGSKSNHLEIEEKTIMVELFIK